MQLNPNDITISISPPIDLYLRSHLLHCSQMSPFLLPRDCELYRDREHLLKYFVRPSQDQAHHPPNYIVILTTRSNPGHWCGWHSGETEVKGISASHGGVVGVGAGVGGDSGDGGGDGGDGGGDGGFHWGGWHSAQWRRKKGIVWGNQG